MNCEFRVNMINRQHENITYSECFNSFDSAIAFAESHKDDFIGYEILDSDNSCIEYEV